MAFNWNRFAYTNFHELNLDWFSEHFKEIFEEWEELYNTLTQWKDDTDADLAQWKEDTLADMDTWERELLAALDEWKTDTGNDINNWEAGVISDLNDWKETFLAAYESLEDRVEAIVSDTEDMVENLAEPFDSTKNYLKNDYVVYNGILYKFTSDHPAGLWNSEHVEQSTAMKDIRNIQTESLQTFVTQINATYITNNNITKVHDLEPNKMYLLNNVGANSLSDMPNTGSNYNGCLIWFKTANLNSFNGFIYINNQGEFWSGIDVNNTTIRWKKSADTSLTDSLSTIVSGLQLSVSTLENQNPILSFGEQINASYLSTHSITSIRDLDANRVYFLNSVPRSDLQDMPQDDTIGSITVYSGMLLKYFGSPLSAHPITYLYIDNLGYLYSGIDHRSGSIRWKKAFRNQTVDDLCAELGNGQKVLLLGDSIMYGSHMSDYSPGNRTVITINGNTYKNNLSTTVWSYLFSEYLTSVYNVTVVNNSYPGAKIQDIITYYSTLVTDTYRIVFICLGINDASSVSNIKTYYKEIIKKFAEKNIRVVFLMPLDSTTYSTGAAKVRGAFKQAAFETSTDLANLFSDFNLIAYLKNIAIEDCMSDGVHYTDAVQPLIFEAAKHCLHL